MMMWQDKRFQNFLKSICRVSGDYFKDPRSGVEVYYPNPESYYLITKNFKNMTEEEKNSYI